MKFLNIKLVLIILLWSLVSMAQSPDITELEYYFDIDPGFGNGTSVTVSPDTVTSTTFNLDISGLSAGIHNAFVRAKDENDVWSFVNKMIIQKVETPPITNAEKITELEYFYDVDPGFGNGTQIPVVDGIVTNTTFDIDISGLSSGYHKVYFRSKNENRVWSLIYTQNIVKIQEDPLPVSTDIVSMEYFFDTDPGFGNGTSVPVTTGTVINKAFDIDVSGLDAGYHKVYVRTKNENRVWSLACIQNLVKVWVEPFQESSDIVSLEYFVDTDPGFGNGTAVSVSPADSIVDYTFGVDVSALTAGNYDFYVRVQDENKNWSLTNIIPFEVTEVELTAFLEAPYNGSTMDTDLNGVLPLNQPFNTSPWNYTGTENVGVIPNANVVDWVLLETRHADEASLATADTRSSRYAGFLLNDGSIVDLNGVSNLKFNAYAETNNFIIIHHRNHLGVLSADELNYSGGIFDYNFMSGLGQAYGSGQKDLGSGFYGMVGGNANSDGIISELDLTEKWDLEAGKYGYYFGDMNMDTEVDNEDKNDLWLQNLGSSSTIPE